MPYAFFAAPATSPTGPDNLPQPQSLIIYSQDFVASGTISICSGHFTINAAGTAATGVAVTLPVPDVAGQRIAITNVAAPTSGVNTIIFTTTATANWPVQGASATITPLVGDTVEFLSYAGGWVVARFPQNTPTSLLRTISATSAPLAGQLNGNFIITAASAQTIALPTPTAADAGAILKIEALNGGTAYAHVLSYTSGFNAKGSSGTITFGTTLASGQQNGVELWVSGTNYYVARNVNGTVA